MPIYTKKGDKGKTGLYTSDPEKKRRVAKDSLIVNALGNIDELDSYLGVTISECEDKKTFDLLRAAQNNLLTIGSIIAGSNLKIKKLETTKIESVIDEIQLSLPKLSNFVFPGGARLSSHLQFSRSLARRAERGVVALSKETKIDKNILQYLNRLSDFLFVLARKATYDSKFKEEIWVGKKRT